MPLHPVRGGGAILTRNSLWLLDMSTRQWRAGGPLGDRSAVVVSVQSRDPGFVRIFQRSLPNVLPPLWHTTDVYQE